MRPIDADKLKDSIIYTCDAGGWIGSATMEKKKLAIKYIDNVPTIETKQIKYYDDEESVWKVGSVIVDE